VERSGRAAAVTFYSPDDFVAGVTVTLGDEAAQHARVIRIGAGEPVQLRNGRGGGASGVLARVSKRSLTVDVSEVWEIERLPPIHMLVPVADRDRMLYLAEKVTELGATSWRPVMSSCQTCRPAPRRSCRSPTSRARSRAPTRPTVTGPRRHRSPLTRARRRRRPDWSGGPGLRSRP